MENTQNNNKSLLDEQPTGWQARLQKLATKQSRRRRRWYQRWLGKLLLIVVSLFIILVTIFIYKVINLTWQIKTNQLSINDLGGQSGQNPNSTELIQLSKGQSPYYLGTSSPKVLIVEYGDFNCKYCRVTSPIIRQVITENKDIVQYVWRNWPGQENSELLAQAALCAGEQAGNLGFWLFHYQFLLNQGQYENIDQVAVMAEEFNLSGERIRDCLAQKRMIAYLQKDYIDAMDLGGINGTPTWLINGYKFTGELPVEFFNYMIKELTKQ